MPNKPAIRRARSTPVAKTLQDRPRHRLEHKEVFFSDLQSMADKLNGKGITNRREAEAWDDADNVLQTCEEEPACGIDLYMSFFGTNLLARLMVKLEKGAIHCFPCPVAGPSQSERKRWEDDIGYLLWDVAFRQKGYERLKLCVSCEQWFVDRGKNKIARFCSVKCTTTYWNRATRREARKRRATKRTATRRTVSPKRV